MSAWFNLVLAVALLQWYLPWEPRTFMSRGYFTHILVGFKTFIFHLFWGPRVYCIVLVPTKHIWIDRGNLTSQSKRCGTAYTENEPIPVVGLGEEVNKHYVRMFRWTKVRSTGQGTPPSSLTWQWEKLPWMKMYLLQNMVIFHCHVSFPGVHLISTLIYTYIN